MIFVDGSSRGNPGPGGWAVVLIENGEVVETMGQQLPQVTNNQMELTAILEALKKYGVDESEFFYPVLYSDSQYSVNVYTKWMFNWAANNWIKSDENIPLNLDIIKEFYDLWVNKGKRLDIRWVKGHSDSKGNNLADAIATGKINLDKDLKGEKNEHIIEWIKGKH